MKARGSIIAANVVERRRGGDPALAVQGALALILVAGALAIAAPPWAAFEFGEASPGEGDAGAEARGAPGLSVAVLAAGPGAGAAESPLGVAEAAAIGAETGAEEDAEAGAAEVATAAPAAETSSFWSGLWEGPRQWGVGAWIAVFALLTATVSFVAGLFDQGAAERRGAGRRAAGAGAPRPQASALENGARATAPKELAAGSERVAPRLPIYREPAPLRRGARDPGSLEPAPRASLDAAAAAQSRSGRAAPPVSSPVSPSPDPGAASHTSILSAAERARRPSPHRIANAGGGREFDTRITGADEPAGRGAAPGSARVASQVFDAVPADPDPAARAEAEAVAVLALHDELSPWRRRLAAFAYATRDPATAEAAGETRRGGLMPAGEAPQGAPRFSGYGAARRRARAARLRSAPAHPKRPAADIARAEAFLSEAADPPPRLAAAALAPAGSAEPAPPLDARAAELADRIRRFSKTPAARRGRG